MSKPVILTGLRANNDLHIGNYFGGLLPLIDMARNHADEYEINLFVPDLHSFTTPIDHSLLQSQILHNLKLFVAAGLPLDNDNIHIYRQSYIPAHSELTWILDCFTGFGEMSRMTQFKDKGGPKDSIDRFDSIIRQLDEVEGDDSSKFDAIRKILVLAREALEEGKHNNKVSIGLFNYPVLMAADILLYGATYVPVGDDQTQHLEFTRDIAERMNSRFGDLFVIPKPVKEQHEFFGKDQGLRIKDLADPTKKMSKSDDTGKGVIFLGDSPEAATKKIMSATTDSEGVIRYDVQKQPGIASLLQILALAEGKDVSSVVHSYEGQTSYGSLKTAVATSVSRMLSDFQARMSEVDEAALMDKLSRDEVKMTEVANATLVKVQKAVGLR